MYGEEGELQNVSRKWMFNEAIFLLSDFFFPVATCLSLGWQKKKTWHIASILQKEEKFPCGKKEYVRVFFPLPVVEISFSLPPNFPKYSKVLLVFPAQPKEYFFLWLHFLFFAGAPASLGKTSKTVTPDHGPDFSEPKSCTWWWPTARTTNQQKLFLVRAKSRQNSRIKRAIPNQLFWLVPCRLCGKFQGWNAKQQTYESLWENVAKLWCNCDSLPIPFLW